MYAELPTDDQIADAIVHAAKHHGYGVTYFVKQVTGSGDTVDRIRGGMSMSRRRQRTVLQNLSDNWPPDLEWPADIPRPRPTSEQNDATKENAA